MNYNCENVITQDIHTDFIGYDLGDVVYEDEGEILKSKEAQGDIVIRNGV